MAYTELDFGFRVVPEAGKTYTGLVVRGQGPEWVVQGFQFFEVEVVGPELLGARHERGGKVMRLVIAARDMDDAALDLQTFARAGNKRRFFNDVGFYRNELRISDVIAEVVGGSKFARDIGDGLQCGEEPVDRTTDGVPLSFGILTDRAVRLPFEVFEEPELFEVLASLLYLGRPEFGIRCLTTEPVLAEEAVSSDESSPFATPFGMAFLAGGAAESPFLGTESI